MIVWSVFSERVSKGNLGRFIQIQPNEIRQLKSKKQQIGRCHYAVEQLLDTSLPKQGRLFPIIFSGQGCGYLCQATSAIQTDWHSVPLTCCPSPSEWTGFQSTTQQPWLVISLHALQTSLNPDALTLSASVMLRSENVDGIRLPDWECTS